MNFIIKMNILIVLVLVSLVWVEPTFAAGLVPDCEGASCNSCHLVQLGNNVLKWLIGVLFVVFAILIAVGGFEMVTSGGNPAAKTSAKSKITNALIGILILLAGWLLVDTLIRGLLSDGSGKIDGRFWYEVECVGQNVPTLVREADDPSYTYDKEPGNSSGGAGSTIPPPTGGSSIPAHDAAWAMLNPDGFSIVSSGNCVDPSKSRCTSLAGVRDTTISRLNQLQSAAGEKLVITGGTETGHATMPYSHSNGYKIDLRPSTKLNEYITTNFERIGNNKYQDSNGNTYYRHPPDHWDITITR